MTKVDEIVAGLTAAQREALVEAPSTPLGNSWLVCRGSTKTALVSKRLASGHGEWCTLTDLGKAVRDVLAQAIEAQRAGTTKIGSVADESAVAESDAPKGDGMLYFTYPLVGGR